MKSATGHNLPFACALRALHACHSPHLPAHAFFSQSTGSSTSRLRFLSLFVRWALSKFLGREASALSSLAAVVLGRLLRVKRDMTGADGDDACEVGLGGGGDK